MEKDVLDTQMTDDLDANATSIIDERETHEQAKCNPFASPYLHSTSLPFSTTPNDFSCLSIMHNIISRRHNNNAIKFFSQLTN